MDRFYFDCESQQRNRLIRLALIGQDYGQVVPCLSIVGIQLDGCFQVLNGCIKLSSTHESQAKIVLCFWVVKFDPQCLLVMGNRLW